jgi:hypothetical protein
MRSKFLYALLFLLSLTKVYLFLYLELGVHHRKCYLPFLNIHCLFQLQVLHQMLLRDSRVIDDIKMCSLRVFDAPSITVTSLSSNLIPLFSNLTISDY